MVTTASQRKWRDKHRYVKTQLNVMARKLVHRYLTEITVAYGLRGKGEAVTFAVFITRALMQRAEFDPATALPEEAALADRLARQLALDLADFKSPGS